MTKPRPDQPGRWRKGSPRIEWDRERADRLQEEVEEYDATLTRQSDLLTRTVNALRGDPPPLTSWSHHDIPELAAEKVAEVERLTAERDAAIERLERVIDQWPAQVWVCDCVPSPQPTDPGCGCSTNPARARYADGDPAGCYCTCSDDAREDCEHEPDEPQPTDQEDQS